MNYQELIRWLEEVPLYGHKDGVNNIRKLMARFDNPQQSYQVIHVAGTNGKGSVCAMLESVLRSSGCKVGLFTSPHLVDYPERIQVNRQPISRQRFTQLGLLVKAEVEAMVREGENHCTFFEILTAMGFLYFREQGVDVVVLETGVGGRLDATNIVEPPALRLTVITSISLDHTKVLGDTREKIAGEKAGILRPNVPIILAPNQADVQRVVEERANALGSPYLYAGSMGPEDRRRFTADHIRYTVPLEGDYQEENLTTVLAAIDCLRKGAAKSAKESSPEEKTIPPITDEAILRGLRDTQWPGRMERRLFLGKPLLLDGAHNPDGAEKLAAYLTRSCPKDSVTLVFSALGKKDVSGILGKLRDCPAVRDAIFTRIHGEENEQRFIDIWQEKKSYRVVPEPMEALTKAASGPGELVVCAGSLYLIGEIMEKDKGAAHV